jgi:hypothetical protein
VSPEYTDARAVVSPGFLCYANRKLSQFQVELNQAGGVNMRRIVVLTLLLALTIEFLTAGERAQMPMSEAEVLRVRKKSKKDQMKAMALIGESSVGFDVTPSFAKRLEKGRR